MDTTTIRFETYEWDNVWLEHADTPERKRVLYIGDSISCGTRHIATNMTDGQILFDGFGTSKSLDNPWFMDNLRLISIVTHVADAKSCVLHPASHTHRQLSEEQLKEAGIAPDLIRLSVGIEDAEDEL